MCKINGQSIFKWMFATPLAVKDEFSRKKTKTQPTDTSVLTHPVSAEEQVEKTADTVKQSNKNNLKRPLSSLRIPLLNTSNTGVNTGANSGLGLNLGG